MLASVLLAAARSLGLSAEEISAGLNSFGGLAHRMEEVGRAGKLLFINDSKATNAEAAEKALVSFENIYWIAGGREKTGGITTLQPHFGRIRKAFLIGEAAEPFAATLKGNVPFEISGDLETAVRQATRAATDDGAGPAVVLLSPAAASFDQFTSFEARGDAFREVVRKLIAEELS